VVKRFFDRQRDAALQKGTELVNGMADRLDRHVQEISRDPTGRKRAEDAGIRIRVGQNRAAGSGGAGASPHASTPGAAPWTGRQGGFRISIEATKRGGVGEKTWEIDPKASAHLRAVLPPNFTMMLQQCLPAETQREIERLPAAEKFWVHVFKAAQAALFFNFNFTPGIAYAGLFLDVGFVIPIVVTMLPAGEGGTDPDALLSAGGIFPMWVRGKSIQIFGNRTEKVSTAGIFVK
jgi:hypothetical protein